MKKVLILPAPFRVKNPTTADQNAYLISLLEDEAAMGKYGHCWEVNTLEESVYKEEINRIVAEQKPDWVIASGESATACMNLHRQKKILINPVVTYSDLNNVPEYARHYTYGFFGALPEQEACYDLFQTVYPKAAWYFNRPDLQMSDVRDMIVDIIGD